MPKSKATLPSLPLTFVLYWNLKTLGRFTVKPVKWGSVPGSSWLSQDYGPVRTFPLSIKTHLYPQQRWRMGLTGGQKQRKNIYDPPVLCIPICHSTMGVRRAARQDTVNFVEVECILLNDFFGNILHFLLSLRAELCNCLMLIPTVDNTLNWMSWQWLLDIYLMLVMVTPVPLWAWLVSFESWKVNVSAGVPHSKDGGRKSWNTVVGRGILRCPDQGIQAMSIQGTLSF